MLGCNESNIIFQQHLYKLGQLRRRNGRNVQVFGQRNLWPPHFCTFCELVEGEENKLTTFSTWTIMLGCNESNIIFQQHLYKLGQLRRRNGRYSVKEIYGRHTFVLRGKRMQTSYFPDAYMTTIVALGPNELINHSTTFEL